MIDRQVRTWPQQRFGRICLLEHKHTRAKWTRNGADDPKPDKGPDPLRESASPYGNDHRRKPVPRVPLSGVADFAGFGWCRHYPTCEMAWRTSTRSAKIRAGHSCRRQ
jgi:hypothetical protein